MSFLIATTVDEAIAALANGARPIAGGSDLVVGARHGKFALPSDLVAIDRIAALWPIVTNANGSVRVGALANHAELEVNATIVGGYSALADGAALVGSPATRHVGTLGGNVMNASPAMDTGAPLVVLGASVELRSADSTRMVTVGELWTGPGRTSAAANELCVAVHLPARPERSGSAYLRLEYRRAMEIAVVGAAASVALNDDGTLAALEVALTAVAPTILAVTGTASFAGRAIDDALLAEIAEIAADQATPISDVRASDRYRRHTVGVMARRAVAAAADRARGVTISVPVNRAQGIGAAR
jgi:CO/xanthine dehydrogenase FAD-binding subunit